MLRSECERLAVRYSNALSLNISWHWVLINSRNIINSELHVDNFSIDQLSKLVSHHKGQFDYKKLANEYFEVLGIKVSVEWIIDNFEKLHAEDLLFDIVQSDKDILLKVINGDKPLKPKRKPRAKKHKDDNLGMALWYIRKIGDLALARKTFEAACKAYEILETP